MSNPVVSLWLKSEVFSIGSLPISPNSRLTVNNIKKIIPYVKSKDKRNHPNLSYSVWKHIACNKLMHSEEIAWIYFWVFDTLLDKTPEERLLHWDSHAYATKTGETQAEQERGQLTVPALPFTLFLFIQHLHKISLKASLVTGSDEWPSRTRSPDIDSRLNVSGYKGSDESAQLNFVMNNLNDILDLLVVEDGQQNKKDATVPLRSLEALEFFIVGSINKAKDIKPLRELAILQAQKTGYCKTTASFSFKGLQTWLRSNLTQNPFGTSNCLSQGRNLCWPLQGESREKWSEAKKGNILTNAVFVPKEHSRGNKLIILNQMCKTTIARSSGTLEGSSVRISRCNNSFIYLLSPLRSVIIEKCQRSTIVLGAVETSIDLNRCEQVTVIGVTRRFSAQGCKSCNIHMLTPNTPLLFNNNTQLIFGPYHTFYPQLEEHMCVSGLSPVVNLWDSPIILGTGNVTEEKIFELQKPSDFYPFEIPFEMEGRTKDIPLGLPVRYQRALVQRKKKLEEWQKYLNETPLNSDQKKLLHQSVQAKFQEFLQMSGYAGYLESLATSSDQNESPFLCEKTT